MSGERQNPWLRIKGQRRGLARKAVSLAQPGEPSSQAKAAAIAKSADLPAPPDRFRENRECHIQSPNGHVPSGYQPCSKSVTQGVGQDSSCRFRREGSFGRASPAPQVSGERDREAELAKGWGKRSEEGIGRTRKRGATTICSRSAPGDLQDIVGILT
jgi:hypothetical protein